MAIEEPVRVGEPETLFAIGMGGWERKIVRQRFTRPGTGGVDDFFLFHHDPERAAVALAVTTQGEIIALRQFRYGAGIRLIEIPGGAVEGHQTPEAAVRREIGEETGYRVGELIALTPASVWADPAVYMATLHLFLAKDCSPGAGQRLGQWEHLEVMAVPLAEWLRLIWSGAVRDLKTIGITLLALPYLGARIELPPQR